MKLGKTVMAIAFMAILGFGGCKRGKEPSDQKPTAMSYDTGVTVEDEKTGIIGWMSKFREIHVTPHPIDPNRLQVYKISYDAPELIGKIITHELGYFENSKFVKPKGFFAFHIEEPNEIFDWGRYQWMIKVRKPWKMRRQDFVTKYPRGFKAFQVQVDSEKRPIGASSLYVFPVEDMGWHYKAISQKVIFTWTSGINGHYKGPSADVNDTSMKPADHMYLVQKVEAGSRFKLTKSF
jgi:hypothetical protein